MGICRFVSPILQPTEYDIDPVAALIVLDVLAARLPGGDSGPYPFVFLCIFEPISVVASVCQQPLRGWKASQQGRGTCVVADLICSHEEAVRASLRMQFGVHTAFGSADQRAPLVARCPFWSAG